MVVKQTNENKCNLHLLFSLLSPSSSLFLSRHFVNRPFEIDTYTIYQSCHIIHTSNTLFLPVCHLLLHLI
ncbi:hypothetical protein CW304_16380 [Bacillus sp. UFRGS-B20]|nr:hypothetical protein CW304_16380 [Bacillus sp. UFRGS-B20]